MWTASRDADLPPMSKSELIGTGGCLVMIALVLGGIWSGMFTPTEGAGIGALLALVLALIKGAGTDLSRLFARLARRQRRSCVS